MAKSHSKISVPDALTTNKSLPNVLTPFTIAMKSVQTRWTSLSRGYYREGLTISLNLPYNLVF